MVQKDSYALGSSMFNAGYCRLRVHLALCSLVGRPMMFNITAVMYPKDSCDMVPMFDCRKLRSLGSCSPSRSSTTLFAPQRQIPMVQAIQQTTEIPQLLFDFRWSMPCCAVRAGSLHRRGAEAVSYGPDCSSDHRDFAVAVRVGLSMSLLCWSHSSPSADVEETVELPQLRLVFLRGHCRAHSRRCATTDAGWFRRHSCCDVARLISSWRR